MGADKKANGWKSEAYAHFEEQPSNSAAGDLIKPRLCYTLGTIQKVVPLDVSPNNK